MKESQKASTACNKSVCRIC